MTEIRRTRPEDYLAAIETLAEQAESSRATTGNIAQQIDVSKGTVSGVLKELADQGLVDLIPYEGAMLTEVGRKRARYTVRRQRLLEFFLNQSLGIGWESVAEEAWRLEPGASEKLIERIDAALDHPEYDPQGDPIPRPDGSLPHRIVIPLTSARLGVVLVVARIVGLSNGALHHLSTIGLAVGSEITLRTIATEGGVVELETSQGPATIGIDLASGILVKDSRQA